MKVLAYVHAYPPHHNAGAEWMLHAMLKGLVALGHECHVLMNFNALDEKRNKSRYPDKRTYNFEGVNVWDFAGNAETQFQWCDVVLTHLEKGSDALHGAPKWCRRYRKPLARIVHNERELHFFNATRETTDLVIFNSEWIRDVYNTTLTDGWASIVFRPPIDNEYYSVDRDGAQAITLINLTENKGAKLFYDLARAMPERTFIAVKGGYDQQMIARMPNVEIVENTHDIRPIYARTRILLVPSLIETYGRVAVEAMCSGIPVIANTTAGLVEACSNAATYCDRNKIGEWITAIKALDDATFYAKRSNDATERAKALTPDYVPFEQALTKMLTDYKPTVFIDTDNDMKKTETKTIPAIARRNFTHKSVAYTKGPVEIAESEYGFLVMRMLIEAAPKPAPVKAKDIEPVDETKPEPKAVKRETKKADK